MAIASLMFIATAITGHFWMFGGFILVLVLVGWALMDNPLFQRISIWMLFLGQLLMAAAWLRPDEFNYAAYAVLLVVVAGVAGVMSGRSRPTLMWGFAAWLGLSALFSTVTLRPIPIYGLLSAAVGIIGVTMVLGDDTGRSARVLIRALFTFAAVQAALGILQTVFDLSPLKAFDGIVYEESRNYLAAFIPGMSAQVRMATGTFEHFNGLGALLAIVVPFAFGRWLYVRSRGLLLYLILILAGLIVTFSRGALLGAMVGCVLVYWSRSRASLSGPVRVSFLAFTGLVGLIAFFDIVRSYALETNNLASRLDVWLSGLRYSFGDPFRALLGAGYGFFGSGFLQGQGLVTRLHSAPVQVLAELGLVGALLFLAAVVPPLWRGIHSNDRTQHVLAAGAIAFLTHQLVDNGLFGFAGLLFFGIMSALVAYQRHDAVSTRLPTVWDEVAR